MAEGGQIYVNNVAFGMETVTFWDDRLKTVGPASTESSATLCSLVRKTVPNGMRQAPESICTTVKEGRLTVSLAFVDDILRWYVAAAVRPGREIGTEPSERLTAVSERNRVADVEYRVITHSAKPQ